MVQIPNMGVNIVEMLGVDGAVMKVTPDMRHSWRNAVLDACDKLTRVKGPQEKARRQEEHQKGDLRICKCHFESAAFFTPTLLSTVKGLPGGKEAKEVDKRGYTTADLQQMREGGLRYMALPIPRKESSPLLSPPARNHPRTRARDSVLSPESECDPKRQKRLQGHLAAAVGENEGLEKKNVELSRQLFHQRKKRKKRTPKPIPVQPTVSAWSVGLLEQDPLYIDQCKLLTGFLSWECLRAFFDITCEYAGFDPNASKGNRKLALIDEFFLVLCFLRTSTSLSRVCLDFRVSLTTASRRVGKWLPILAGVFRMEMPYPSAERVNPPFS